MPGHASSAISRFLLAMDTFSGTSESGLSAACAALERAIRQSRQHDQLHPWPDHPRLCIGIGAALIVTVGVLRDAKMDRDDNFNQTGENE